jgi:hypothetical protein
MPGWSIKAFTALGLNFVPFVSAQRPHRCLHAGVRSDAARHVLKHSPLKMLRSRNEGPSGKRMDSIGWFPEDKTQGIM